MARAIRPIRLGIHSGVVAVDASVGSTGDPDRDSDLPELLHRAAPATGSDHPATVGVLIPAVGFTLTAVSLALATIGFALAGDREPVAVEGIRIALATDRLTFAAARQRLTQRSGLPHTEFEAVSIPRLIATDLDGTFLRPDGTVSAVNAAAAAKAAERGVPFVIATGRPARWLGVLDGLTTAHAQVIVSNGGAVVDLATRRALQQFPMTPAVVMTVAEQLRQAIPGTTFGVETAEGFGCEPTSPSRQRDEPGHLIGELPDLIAELGGVIKMLGFHPEVRSEPLTNLAAAVVGEQLTLTHASVRQSYGMIELTAPGISKASTLALLCEELGIEAEDVIAFGDMPNDAEMLAWAGRGYVVANGHNSMKGCGFTEVASNNDDGVGRTILELL